jgi:ribosomal protein S18 acetylase RimI-like enzyme
MTTDPPAFQIRRLSRADAETFRAIRLEGLEQYPAAFSASFNEESNQPLSFFEDRLDKNFVLGAERQNRLVGVAGFYVQHSEKTRHRGILWGMYVREEARGNGIARQLVEGIMAHARQHVEEVALSVWAGNVAAIACYNSAGFSVTAQDARALKIGGAYFDLLLMQVRFANG